MGIYKLQRVYYKRDIVEYPEGVVKFESSTPGTYDVDINSGQYEIICVGGGGAGAHTSNNAHGSGGSGGYSNQTMSLTKDTYFATVGSGGTSVGYITPAGSGTGTWSCSGSAGGASSFYTVNATGGGGGHAEFSRSKLFSSIQVSFYGSGGSGGTGVIQNGNAGGGTPRGTNPSGVYAGGASVYNGYGAGGNSNTVGGAGYVKIICYSEETVVPSTADDYDFYEDKMLKIGEFYEGSTKIGSLYKGSILVFGKTQTIFEQETPGIYTITIPYEADFKITAVGAGGRANYRCAYDDRGYIGCGGSGGAFIGKIHLTPGRYDVQIGSCAAGSSRTTFINEVLTVGGGGDGATNPIGGAAGAAPILNITPTSEELNTAGNAGGAYSSGNGGGGATWNYNGAASVYGGYGRGGGGKVCEYASTSSANEASGEPYNPTNGYLKIEL